MGQTESEANVTEEVRIRETMKINVNLYADRGRVEENRTAASVRMWGDCVKVGRLGELRGQQSKELY